jgi:type IV secretory pathway TraG/TraD family ATPase VirD4
MGTMGFIQSAENETRTKEPTSSIIVDETFTHSIAFGQTGCGKTTSFIYPNLKHRLNLGHGILLYDYKGKEHLSVKALAQEAGRLGDVVEIGKPWGENINLIQKMDEDELDKFFDNILKHGEDSKYWQNSAKSLGQTLLQVLKGIESFADALTFIEGTRLKEINFLSYSYPTKRTLQSLVQICKTFETLKAFISNLPALQKYIEKLIEEAARNAFEKNSDPKIMQAQFAKLISTKKTLEIIIETNQNSLDSFGEDSNENLTQNIMGSLISPLVSLSQNRAFNTDSFDIAKALNNGSIIIINVESLSSAALESLSNTILYELSKRTKSLNINPISIFIDEVQRVVSKNSDLPIDVMREAKVDMFLATQNTALLKEKLKDEKFDALMGNLTQKFYYKSSVDEELESENDLKTLQAFEYISLADNFMEVHAASALFMDEKRKMLVEFSYQKSLNVLEDFLYKHREKRIILDYDSRLYKDNKIIAINIESKREHILESMNKANITYLTKEVNALFSKTKKRLLHTEVEEQDHDYDPLEEYWAS